MEKKSTEKVHKKKRAHTTEQSEDQYMLSFERFIAQQKIEEPSHGSDEEEQLEMEIEKLDDEDYQDEGEQLEDDQRSHEFRKSGNSQGNPVVAVTPKAILKAEPARNPKATTPRRQQVAGNEDLNGDPVVDVTPKTILKVEPARNPNATTPRRQQVAGNEDLNAMPSRDLLILAITENRATYTLLHRVEAKHDNLHARVTKIENMLAGHSSGEVYKLVWPVSTRIQLEKIEADLGQQNGRTRKALEKQYKRADRSSLYKFLHGNLGGLLSGTGRWSWTGKPSQPKTYPDGSIRSDKGENDEELEEAEEAEEDEQTSSNPNDPNSLYTKSSPANSLNSVQLLHELCYQLFDGVSETNLVKETRHVLTNMNNAYQKRKMRASDGGPHKRIR